MNIQRLVRRIPVPDKVVDVILKLVRSAPRTGVSRDRPLRRLGPRPACQPGPDARRARQALIDGRLAPRSTTCVALAEPMLKHRMALTFAARAEGQDLRAIIAGP